MFTPYPSYARIVDDLYMLPMKRPGIVLGIQWLQKLREVTHDYAEQTMKSTLINKEYSLQGDESLRMKQIILHRIQELLETEDVYGVNELHNLLMEKEVHGTTLAASELGDLKIKKLLAQFDTLFQ
ncbi:hypothetical protein Tco_1261219, partial [Tanacetum coccineum]